MISRRESARTHRAPVRCGDRAPCCECNVRVSAFLGAVCVVLFIDASDRCSRMSNSLYGSVSLRFGGSSRVTRIRSQRIRILFYLEVSKCDLMKGPRLKPVDMAGVKSCRERGRLTIWPDECADSMFGCSLHLMEPLWDSQILTLAGMRG